MTDTPNEYALGPLVPLTLRVGVTGHRPGKLPAGDVSLLEARIGEVVRAIEASLQAVAGRAEAAVLFRQDGVGPRLHLASGLAEGVDRMVADPHALGLSVHFELAAVLAFEQVEFEQDFVAGASQTDPDNGTVGMFRDMLAGAARVVELDGTRDEGDAAYARVGRHIADHSDLMIAVWDPQAQDPGIGGTAHVIDMALARGLMVLCIDPGQAMDTATAADTVTARLGPGQSPIGGGEGTAFAPQALTEYLAYHLLLLSNEQQAASRAEAGGRPGKHPLDTALYCLEQYAHEKGFTDAPDIAPDYQDGGPLNFSRGLGGQVASIFTRFRNLVAGRASVARTREENFGPATSQSGAASLPAFAREPEKRETLDRFFAAYLRADRLASYYASLHRSIFVMIYLFGAVALSFAAAALFWHEAHLGAWKVKHIFAYGELAILGSIFALWRMDHRWRFHSRWIEYRSIAEMLRPMGFLSLFGHTYLLNKLRDRQEEILQETIAHSGASRGWVFPYVETGVRWAWLVGAKFDEAYLQDCKKFIGQAWLDHQIDYHEQNAARMHVMGHNLHVGSFGLTVLTIVAVLVKLFLVKHLPWLDFTALLAGVLPALAGASFAIRNHAEFDISAQRSQSMRTRLLRFRARLDETPATSDALGALVYEIACETINETTEWGDIFEVKVSEAG